MTKVSKHIILVEDNPDDAELIQLELDKLDIPIQIHRASGMEDFKALLEKITPDLIMSDYNLGDCNGLDIFSVVKERVLHPPFIIVSGYIGEEKAVEAVKQGIDDYVLKDHLARLQPVTERLLLASKSEENRRLWEHIFFSVIENAAVGLLLLDENLNIVMTNRLITEMSGYTEKELIGQSKSILYSENMTESWFSEVKGLLNSGEGSASHEWVMNKKDESFRQVHSTLTPITIKENKKYILSFVTDVTEQKREDRLLRQTESISGVGGWQYNVLDDSVFLTKKAVEIFGLVQKEETDPEVDRLIAKFEEESQKKIREAMSAAISQNESYRLECRLNSKDQRKIKIIEITGQPVVASEKTVMLYGSIEDITEEKERQQEMQKLSMVARKTENAVIITDAEGNIEWVNEAFTRSTKYSLEEVEGKNPGDLLQGPLTEPETVARMHQHIKAKEGFTEELINYTKSGKPYWIRITVTPLLDEGGHLKQFFSIQEDITERKQAENELKEAEQHYRQIIEQSTNLFYQHDPNHVFTYVSPQSKQFLGLPAESIDDVWTNFVTDNPANRRGKELTKKAIKTGEPQPSYELEIRKANGETCWVQVNESPVVEDGKTTSIVGSLTDITKLKRVQNELIQNEERLKEAQRIGQIGDWYFDVESGAVSWSEQMFRIYDRDINKGAPDYEEIKNYYSDENWKIIDDAVEKAIEQKENYLYEIEILTGNKDRKYVEAQGLVRTDEAGEVIQLYGTVQDITDRKLKQMKHREQEKRLRNITNNIDGVVIQYTLNPDGSDSLSYVSKGASKIWGYTAEEVTKDDSPIWNNIASEDINEVRRTIAQSAESMEVWNHVYRYNTPDGSVKWLHGRGTPKSSNNGSVVWDIVITDITELKNTEQEVEILLQEVHHRVKNNLAIISGLLQLEEFQTDNEDLILPLRHSQNRIQSMAKVHELLYRKQQFSSINIGDYLEEMTETIEKTISDGQKADVNIKADGHELNVNSAIPLGMLLNELISNSFKYAFTNGTKGRIDIEVKNLGDQKFSVCYRDNGKGMKSNVTIENPNSLGLTLIKTLLTQLEADYQMDTKNKFELSFTFEEKQRGAHSLI